MSLLHKELAFLSLSLTGRPVRGRLGFSKDFQYWRPQLIVDYQRRQLDELVQLFFKLGYFQAGCELGHPEMTLEDRLNMLPFIDKSQINELSLLVRRKNNAGKGVIEKSTSGSSGNPVTILKDARGVACELAATWRSYEWAGVHAGDRGVRVWGRGASHYKSFKNRIVDIALNRSRISAFEFDDLELKKRLSFLRKSRPRYIYGYTSIVRELARFAKGEREGLDRLVAVITTAEPLDNESRRVIEEGFGVKCFDEYGCSEVGSIAHECEHGALHVMSDNLIVEVVAGDGKSVVNEVGEVVVTDLTNRVMPMLRYRVGDYAALSHDPCLCGRAFPVLKSIHGRVEDLLFTPDGLNHHPASVCYIVDELHSHFGCIQQYQVVQQSVDSFILFIVPSKKVESINLTDLNLKFQSLLRRRLHDGLHGKVVFCERIEREESGKYRLVKRAF